VRQLGFRYHLANLHAAIGLAQLAKLPRIGAARRDACALYDARFADLQEVRTPQTDYQDIVPMLYYVRVPAGARDDLRRHLAGLGVDTGIHWQPGHVFTLLRNCRRGDMTVTDRLGGEILTLPLHSDYATDTLDRVVAGVRSFFEDR
jgi:dTDP-4-amino-4,6-dideoxygalactose transaminase